MAGAFLEIIEGTGGANGRGFVGNALFFGILADEIYLIGIHAGEEGVGFRFQFDNLGLHLDAVEKYDSSRNGTFWNALVVPVPHRQDQRRDPDQSAQARQQPLAQDRCRYA